MAGRLPEARRSCAACEAHRHVANTFPCHRSAATQKQNLGGARAWLELRWQLAMCSKQGWLAVAVLKLALGVVSTGKQSETRPCRAFPVFSGLQLLNSRRRGEEPGVATALSPNRTDLLSNASQPPFNGMSNTRVHWAQEAGALSPTRICPIRYSKRGPLLQRSWVLRESGRQAFKAPGFPLGPASQCARRPESQSEPESQWLNQPERQRAIFARNPLEPTICQATRLERHLLKKRNKCRSCTKTWHAKNVTSLFNRHTAPGRTECPSPALGALRARTPTFSRPVLKFSRSAAVRGLASPKNCKKS